jgi:hypothetical protein
MIVSNTTPLSNLIQLNLFTLLKALWGQVTIPNVVAEESGTSGRAGGLNCEPLKAVFQEPPKGGLLPHKQLHLFQPLIRFFLLFDISAHCLFILPRR